MPKQKSSCTGYLKSWDSLGDDKRFLIAGSETYTTIFGALTSIVFLIMVMGYAGYLMGNLISRSST